MGVILSCCDDVMSRLLVGRELMKCAMCEEESEGGGDGQLMGPWIGDSLCWDHQRWPLIGPILSGSCASYVHGGALYLWHWYLAVIHSLVYKDPPWISNEHGHLILLLYLMAGIPILLWIYANGVDSRHTWVNISIWRNFTTLPKPGAAAHTAMGPPWPLCCSLVMSRRFLYLLACLWITLEVSNCKDVRHKPTNLTVVEYGSTSITLTWDPAKAKATWYQLWFWPVNSSLDLAMATTVEQHFTLVDLIPGETYNIWLLGINGNETSDYVTLQHPTSITLLSLSGFNHYHDQMIGLELPVSKIVQCYLM